MASEKGGSSRATGLTVGAAGFLGILASPLLGALPAAGRVGSAGVAVVAGSLLLLVAGRRRSAPAALALTLGVALLLAPALARMPPEARDTLAVTALMAAWWISVAIPIAATSLLPLALFPALGVMASGRTAANYANDVIFLFMGGFILALGIQRWGLHRRIALHVVRAVGTDPYRMVLGFMLASAFLSMWISNTATTLMMLPIALAVAGSLREVSGEEGIGELGPALLLGVAYAASIGGLATPIGTPPNIAYLRIAEILYPGAPPISFGRWTLAFLPLTALFLPLAWLVLTRVTHRLGRTRIDAGTGVIREQLRRLGPMGGAERRMLVIFAVTALLWMTRSDVDLGALRIPGWAGLLEGLLGGRFAAGDLHDATVAVAMAILTFLVPGDPDAEGRRRPLMDWDTAVGLPWGILLLFGGGFALADAFHESGLSQYLAESFAGRVAGLGAVALVAATCLLLTFLTEVTSNTATTQVMLPVLGGAAGAMGVHPMLLMLPATLSASCAFMLPIATPPNAIVFGSGQIEMRQMVRSGLVLNLLGAVLVTLVFYFLSSRLLGIDLATVPAWAAG